MSPFEKKAFIFKHACSNSYHSLSSMEGYFKQSASIAALRTLPTSLPDGLP